MTSQSFAELPDYRTRAYVLASAMGEMSYFRAIWKARNKAFRELRERGVDSDIALYLAKQC